MNETNKPAQTPEETAQALSELSEKLDEMAKTRGFFGEAVTDEDLLAVAGGIQIVITKSSEGPPRCPLCGRVYNPNNMPEKCMDTQYATICPLVDGSR